MMNMTEEQIIDVESEEVVEETIEIKSDSHPVKTKEERQYEQDRFNALKKLIKQKRRYYKSNIFQIQKLQPNK